MAIKKIYVVEKQNILNELRTNSMTLQELRFFSIYLSKINPRDINTRIVRFSISDFKKIMELGKININHFKITTDNLLCKIVRIPREDGGYNSFQLFKDCTVGMDQNNEWYVEIDAHDKALPLMFEFKAKYFSYQLWNALTLKSSNQLRMYEILKQYEKIGERIINIDELKDLLGINLNEYSRFNDFKNRVLDSCQKALEESTDIKFKYEPHGKKGRGGKILYLKFIISKNKNYTDPLTLDKFLGNQDILISDDIQENTKLNFENDYLKFYAEACNNEFSELEVQILYNLIIKANPYKSDHENELDWFDYLKRKYDELNLQSNKKNIKKRFNYLKKIIENEL